MHSGGERLGLRHRTRACGERDRGERGTERDDRATEEQQAGEGETAEDVHGAGAKQDTQASLPVRGGWLAAYAHLSGVPCALIKGG